MYYRLKRRKSRMSSEALAFFAVFGDSANSSLGGGSEAAQFHGLVAEVAGLGRYPILWKEMLVEEPVYRRLSDRDRDRYENGLAKRFQTCKKAFTTTQLEELALIQKPAVQD